MMRTTLAACAALALTGCAGSPMRLGFADADVLAQASNYDLCRASASRYANRKMDAEIAHRGVDCAPYIASARAAQAAKLNAAAFIASQPARAPVLAPIPAPTVTRCNPLGGTVQCTTY